MVQIVRIESEVISAKRLPLFHTPTIRVPLASVRTPRPCSLQRFKDENHENLQSSTYLEWLHLLLYAVHIMLEYAWFEAWDTFRTSAQSPGLRRALQCKQGHWCRSFYQPIPTRYEHIWNTFEILDKDIPPQMTSVCKSTVPCCKRCSQRHQWESHQKTTLGCGFTSTKKTIYIY